MKHIDLISNFFINITRAPIIEQKQNEIVYVLSSDIDMFTKYLDGMIKIINNLIILLKF